MFVPLRTGAGLPCQPADVAKLSATTTATIVLVFEILAWLEYLRDMVAAIMQFYNT